MAIGAHDGRMDADAAAWWPAQLGTYQTVEVELNRTYGLAKDAWDDVALEQLQAATDVSQQADTAVVLVDEGIGAASIVGGHARTRPAVAGQSHGPARHAGLAHVCLVTPSRTVACARIDVPIPRKHPGSLSQYDQAVLKFKEAVLQAILRHCNLDVLKCVVLAGPGYMKDDLYDFVFAEVCTGAPVRAAVRCAEPAARRAPRQAARRDLRPLLENRKKFVRAHASSGHKQAISDIFADPGVKGLIESTKAYEDMRDLAAFHRLLDERPECAFYGYEHVRCACDAGAIGTLLLSDHLFRCAAMSPAWTRGRCVAPVADGRCARRSASDPASRAKYVQLTKDVRAHSGSVRIFSSLHPSGERACVPPAVARRRGRLIGRLRAACRPASCAQSWPV